MLRRLVRWCGNEYRNVKNKAVKPLFVKMLLPILKHRSELIKYGFGKICTKSFKAAKAAYDGSVASLLPNLGGRPRDSLSSDIRSDFQLYVREGSICGERVCRPAANRGYFDANGKFVAGKVLNFPKGHIISKFQEVLRSQGRRASRSLLYSYFLIFLYFSINNLSWVCFIASKWKGEDSKSLCWIFVGLFDTWFQVCKILFESAVKSD